MKNDNHLDPKFMQNQTNDNNCRENEENLERFALHGGEWAKNK